MLTKISDITVEEIQKVRAPLENSFTLPKSAYTSERVYDEELERVLRKSWIPVARVEQVAERGTFVTFDFLGQPAMVVHGNDGEIRVMSSVCLHRGAPVANGCGRKNVFTCPYHAWSYDTTGQLRRAPLMEEVDCFSEQELRLPQIRSEIWNGFVVANLDPEAESFSEQNRDFTKYFENFHLEQMEIVDTLVYESEWNWKVLVENFMEAYHHIAIHSKTFEPTNHARDSLIPDNSGPWSILHMPLTAKLIDPDAVPIEGMEDWQSRDLFAAALFPYFLLGIQGQGVAWYQVIPHGVDKMTLKIHLMVPKDMKSLPNFEEITAAIREQVRVIHDEDIYANDLVWAGLTAPLTTQGRLSTFEKSIWQLNQWWLDRMLEVARNDD